MENKRTETNKTVQKRLEPELKLINMDTVEVEQIEWLLYPFIPYGKVTIIQGDPGEGKTTMVLQIIAKLTRGETILPADSTKDKRIDIDSESDMVDAENIENNASTQHLEAPVNVIYQTAEDGLGDTIKPRLLIPYVTGSKRGLDTRVSLKQALSSLGFKGGSRSETELNQWVQSEKQKLAMVMRENEIEWDQKGTHEPHLSVLDYKKKVREQEVEELTEHKNLLEHDLHDISECVDEIQKEKEQAEKERDAVIKKTEVLEKRFSALNSKAGLVDSHAREYGYYPEEWLPEAGTLESAKSYRKRIFPLVKKVANMIQALYSKYLELKSKNQKLSDRNLDLESRVDRLREEVSVIKKENAALLNVAYDMDRVVAVLGENKVKEAIEVAKHLEQANAKRKIKKRRIDREGK